MNSSGRRLNMRRNLKALAAFFAILVIIANTSSETVSGSIDENDFAYNAKLLPTTSDVGMVFGSTVVIDGDTAVIGAPEEDIGRNKKQGAIYVFVKREGVWINQAKLIAADGRRRDRLGAKIAVHGNTIVAGVPTREVGKDRNQGVAYVFTRTGNNWGKQVKLDVTGGRKGTAFGMTVGISGDTLIIGAPGMDNYPDDGVPQAHGAAFVWKKDGDEWTEKQKIMVPSKKVGGLGVGLGMYDKTVALAAAAADAPGVLAAHGIYIFSDDGTGWKEEYKIISSSTDKEQVTGMSPAGNIAMDGNTLIAGGSTELGRVFGAIYVYVRQQGKWIRQGKLTPSDGDGMDTFGLSADLSGDRVVIGEAMNSNQKKGGAYIFERKITPDGIVWIQQQKIFAPDGKIFDTFGHGVAISDKTIVVGANGYDHDRNKPKQNQGAAYVFSVPEETVPIEGALAGTAFRTASGIPLRENADKNGFRILERRNKAFLRVVGAVHPDTANEIDGEFVLTYLCSQSGDSNEVLIRITAGTGEEEIICSKVYSVGDLVLPPVVGAGVASADASFVTSVTDASESRSNPRKVLLLENAPKNGYRLFREDGGRYLQGENVENPFTGRPLDGTWTISYGCEKPTQIESREVGWTKGRSVRLSIACAIIHEPKVLILDEPSPN